MIFFSILLSLTTWAMPATDLHKVPLNNGTFGYYRLLKPHYDPTQASVVHQRLNQTLNYKYLSLPAEYEISSSLIPDVRDQARRPTCVYFATMGALESYYMSQSSKYSDINLSEECLVGLRNWMFDQGDAYTGADKPEERPDDSGDWLQMVAQTVVDHGVPAAEDYSNVSCTYRSAGSKDVPMNDYEKIFSNSESFSFGKGAPVQINRQTTIESIKALIAQNVPVEVGILVYKRYFDGPNWEYNSYYDRESTLAGGHAVLLTGYSTSGTKTVFKFKNSWGYFWGMSGYGTIDDGLLIQSWSYDPMMDVTVSIH
jgi:C1A family cysteine protease